MVYLKQRLGFALPHHGQCLWLHTASVGEVNTALPLIQQLRQRYPTQTLLVTTNTPTGLKALERVVTDNVKTSYLPLDFRFSIKKFFRKNSLHAGIILETEIWPNLFELANCRLAIVNGRLSQRSLRAAEGRAAGIYRATLGHLSLVLARGQTDADAFIRIGADASVVEVLGNLKFAVSKMPARETSRAALQPRPYCLLASTHDNEEVQLTREWLSRDRDELLIIAPRHAERGPAVQRELQSLTKHIAQRSRDDGISSETKIYIADTYGEMQHWYQHATAIFMGGSLIQRGGHNMLEPAALSKSVVTGINTFNFSDEVDALKRDDAIAIAESCETIIDQLIALLDNPTQARERGLRANKVMRRHANVAIDYADRLERWLALSTE